MVICTCERVWRWVKACLEMVNCCCFYFEILNTIVLAACPDHDKMHELYNDSSKTKHFNSGDKKRSVKKEKILHKISC